MPVPTAGRPAMAPAQPTVQAPGVPQAPSAPAAPLAPVSVPAPVNEPKFWVSIGGAPATLHTLTQMRTVAPTAQAIDEAQTQGWQTVGAFLAKYPVVGAPPAAGGFAGRAAPTQTSAAGVPNNLFAGIEGATFFRKNANMTPGEYVAKVTGHEYKQGNEKNMLIVELEILVSSYVEGDPATHEALREGVRASAFIMKNVSWLQNTKEVIIALSGFDPQGRWRTENDTVTAQEGMALVDPSQPYAGALVYLEAKTITTQKGQPFTLVNWWPMPVDATGKPDFDKLRLVRA